MHTPAKRAIQDIIELDKRQEIGLAAYYTNEYLQTPLATRVVEELGYLNMLGWLAYHIYDDWIDEGHGAYPLAIAQMSWRELGSDFATLCRGQIVLHNWVKNILDEVDSANGLDHMTNRLSQIDGTVDISSFSPKTNDVEPCKSIGHALGVGTVFALGSQARNSTLEGVTQFFRNYLTAKQLCDDIHDWEKDLIALRLTPVTRSVLSQYLAEHGKVSITLENELPTLRSIFWDHSMPIVLAQAADHCSKATAWCRDLPWQSKPVFFLDGLQQVQTAIQRCRNEFFKATEFLNTYANIAT